jgi:hypothetical protein
MVEQEVAHALLEFIELHRFFGSARDGFALLRRHIDRQPGGARSDDKQGHSKDRWKSSHREHRSLNH